MTCDEIDDVREPWNIEAPPWLFCEDTSSFHPEEELTRSKRRRYPHLLPGMSRS